MVRRGLVFSSPLRKTSRPQKSTVVHANPITDAGKYLAEAAKQIFSPTESASQPPWDGSGIEFSGSIKHHENAQRLRAVYEAVKSTRQAITGCTDPAALNYDPNAVVDSGTCNYIPDDTQETGMSETLGSYMSQTISRAFSNNFKGDETEPKDWGGNTGYSYRGERVSQRDIMRLLDYEKFVKKTLDKAEAAEK
jgi:hypothetical protein